MKKWVFLSGVAALMTASAAMAQLPANPWDIQPNDGYMGDNVANTDPTQAPAKGIEWQIEGAHLRP